MARLLSAGTWKDYRLSPSDHRAGSLERRRASKHHAQDEALPLPGLPRRGARRADAGAQAPAVACEAAAVRDRPERDRFEGWQDERPIDQG